MAESNILCNFATDKKDYTMDGIFDITKATADEVTAVINGMLNAKEEWLESVRKREKELGIA